MRLVASEDLCISKGVMRQKCSLQRRIYHIHGSWRGEAAPNSNVTIHGQSPAMTTDDLAHPEFPILLSNPSHVLKAVLR